LILVWKILFGIVCKQVNKEKKEKEKKKEKKNTYLCYRAGLPSLPLPWTIGPRPASSSSRLPAWAVQLRSGPSQPEPSSRALSLLSSADKWVPAVGRLLALVTEPETNTSSTEPQPNLVSRIW
jgi:hypothetical protein